MTRSLADFSDVKERLAKTGSVTEALHFIQSVYRVDFITYHLASTVIGDFDTPFVRTTYPDAWVSTYLLKGYVTIDPVARGLFAPAAIRLARTRRHARDADVSGRRNTPWDRPFWFFHPDIG
ncbi:hypothetical protein GGD55_005815 [Rhizobium giardinii]|uniref:Transcription factor LuxR-like autoinducer-binding domain-containing protein n=1 Tax=Rhizobium giardinii TaxID=56731 RepID=A0A7W8UGQ7_9HYPH|nr:hypothetical protein [Rhizobium giardinii]